MPYLDTTGLDTLWAKIKTALSGKANSSHTHAASAITSGTLAAARLPVATTSALGAVKVGTGLSVSSGLISTIGAYIVAQGTCDFWTYRMWSNGIAECWGATSASSYTISSAWGTQYESTVSIQSNLPGGASAYPFSVTIGSTTYSKLFNAAPTILIPSFYPSSGSKAISGIEINPGRTTLKTDVYYLLRPDANAGSNGVKGRMSYYAAGTWK